MLRPVFAFARRGGSKKNLVAISESISNSRFGGVVTVVIGPCSSILFFRIHDVDLTEAPPHFREQPIISVYLRNRRNSARRRENA